MLLFLNPFIDFTTQKKSTKKYKNSDPSKQFAFHCSRKKKINLLNQTGKAAGLKVVTFGKKPYVPTDTIRSKNVFCPKGKGYMHLDPFETHCINLNTIKINKLGLIPRGFTQLGQLQRLLPETYRPGELLGRRRFRGESPWFSLVGALPLPKTCTSQALGISVLPKPHQAPSKPTVPTETWCMSSLTWWTSPCSVQPDVWGMTVLLSKELTPFSLLLIANCW